MSETKPGIKTGHALNSDRNNEEGEQMEYGNVMNQAMTPPQFRSNVPSLDPPPVNGRITEAVQSIVRVSDHLQQEVGLLEQRLSGVLRPAGPAGGPVAKPANVAPSPLASGLEEMHERLYGLLGHVQSLTARVDL